MCILKSSLVLMACSLVSVVSFAQNISNAAFGEVGSYLRQLLDFRKSEVSSLADANRLLLECTDSSNELKCSSESPVLKACVQESERLTVQRGGLLKRYGAELVGTEPGRLLRELTVPRCPEIPASAVVGISTRTNDIFADVAQRNERYDPSAGGDFRAQIDADNVRSTINFFAFNAAPYIAASRERSEQREREEEARVQQTEAAIAAQDEMARQIRTSESAVARTHINGGSLDRNVRQSTAAKGDHASVDYRCRGMYSCYDMYPNCFDVVRIERPPRSSTSNFEDKHKICNRCAISMKLGWSRGIRPGGPTSLYTFKPGECRGAGDTEQSYPGGTNIFLVSSCKSEDFFSSEIQKCVHFNK